jgi:hypothetical protein
VLSLCALLFSDYVRLHAIVVSLCCQPCEKARDTYLFSFFLNDGLDQDLNKKPPAEEVEPDAGDGGGD